MTSEELKQLHSDYRSAVEATRNPESDEAGTKAADHMLDMRRKLDAALIEKEQEREDDARMAAAEARDHATKIIASTQAEAKPTLLRGVPDEEFRAFGDRKVNTMHFDLDMSENRSDIIDETGNAGGHYLVPDTMSDIVNFRIAQSGVLKAGPTILRTQNAQQLNIPCLTTDMATAYHAQGAASTAVSPVWATKDLTAFRCDGHSLVADEMFRDAGVNMNKVIGNLAGRSLAAFVADYLADFEIGTGSTLPNACTLGSTASTATASYSTVTIDELKAVHYGLLPEYRANASWVCLSALALIIMTAKDDTGNYLIQPSNTAAEPDRLWGRPFYEDPYMGSMASAKRPACFGDFEAGYWVRFSGGMALDFSRDFEFTSFSTTIRWAVWMDSVVVDAKALTYLLLAT